MWKGVEALLVGRSPKPSSQEKLPLCRLSVAGILLGLGRFTRRKGKEVIVC